jgi:hypothetical protein
VKEYERILEAVNNDVCKNEEYNRCIKKAINISNKMFDDFCPIQKALFHEYDVLTGLAQGICIESAYSIGMDHIEEFKK